MSQAATSFIRITHIGGPTVLIEIGQMRILTDPTFDPAGTRYVAGPKELIKTTNPALQASSLGTVDVVLLSHDHHADNLDHAGRAYLLNARHVLTTPAGANRLASAVPGVLGVQTWERVDLEGVDGFRLSVTAMPARHGPEAIKASVGEVTGWMLEWDGQPRGALYISGDTVLFEELEEIARRYNVGTALLHFGAAQVDVYGPVYLTFTGAQGAAFAGMLGDATIVPIHYEGWAHFSEGRAEIEQAFEAAGLEEHLRFLPLGTPTPLVL
ncbi:MAG: MBL fold metallo-hydrolase [Chloroflexota bacterium]|nr:MBL fold metallo-hydrolase [Chloroflexota bacterium]